MLNKSGLGFEKWLNVGQSWPTLLISNQTIVIHCPWPLPSTSSSMANAFATASGLGKFARIHVQAM